MTFQAFLAHYWLLSGLVGWLLLTSLAEGLRESAEHRHERKLEVIAAAKAAPVRMGARVCGHEDVVAVRDAISDDILRYLCTACGMPVKRVTIYQEDE